MQVFGRKWFFGCWLLKLRCCINVVLFRVLVVCSSGLVCLSVVCSWWMFQFLIMVMWCCSILLVCMCSSSLCGVSLLLSVYLFIFNLLVVLSWCVSSCYWVFWFLFMLVLCSLCSMLFMLLLLVMIMFLVVGVIGVLVKWVCWQKNYVFVLVMMVVSIIISVIMNRYLCLVFVMDYF